MIKIRPCAKINLGLNIVSERSDGYHNLQTVFYPIPLCDEMMTEERKNGIGNGFSLSLSGIPVDGNMEDNLITRAYRLLCRYHSLPPIHIDIAKHIPNGAGLGGGSSDCAFTLRALNDMFDLNIPRQQLIDYAATLGADCPFFILSEPAYGEGIGELLSPIKTLNLKGYYFALVKPEVHISTREAFSGIKCQYPKVNPRDAIARPIEQWRQLLTNDFETSLFPTHPEIARIKNRLYDMGALYAQMSGSGSSVYGIFTKPINRLSELFPDMFTYGCAL